MQLRSTSDGSTWNAAIPIRDGDSLLGVLLVVSGESMRGPAGAIGLGALVGQIAVGIRVANLRQRTDQTMSSLEWEMLTSRIHDRISSSMYALVLHLETYARVAEREANPMAERLTWLHPHGRHLLFYTRQYMYRLLPLMRGEGTLDYSLRHLAIEFERLSGVGVQLTVSGADRLLPMSTIVAFYDTILSRMADVFHGGTASELNISIDIEDQNTRLSITDNGAVENDDNEMAREGLGRIRRLATDVGGNLRISESRGEGTQVFMDLANRDGSARLDNPADHRRELFSENGNPGDARGG